MNPPPVASVNVYVDGLSGGVRFVDLHGDDVSDEALWALTNQIKADLNWTGGPNDVASVTRWVPTPSEEPT